MERKREDEKRKKEKKVTKMPSSFASEIYSSF
jgi:hypothetical protein